MIPLHEIKKIALFRALQLGDLLCSVPAMRALRKACPQAEITLIGLPWAKSFVERFSGYLDNFIVFPGFPGLPEQPFTPSEVVDFIQTIQNQHFDLAIQMQGNGTIVNPLVYLFSAKYTAGFCLKNDFCADAAQFLEYPKGISEIEKHLMLMNHLGIVSDGMHLEFPITRQDEMDFQQLQLEIDEKKYVCIHPGSRGSWRQWPPEYFASLADYSVSQDLPVVITGTRDETAIVEEVMRHMNCVAINTAGKTSLGAVGVLIRNAYALISNCTGVSHMASAFQTPGVVISMDGEPERWAPLNRQLHRTIDWTKKPEYSLVFAETMALLSLNSQQTHKGKLEAKRS
ncbi:MAG: glycosyltransferase family 9 protein [Chitinophagaceae bacterium]